MWFGKKDLENLKKQFSAFKIKTQNDSLKLKIAILEQNLDILYQVYNTKIKWQGLESLKRIVRYNMEYQLKDSSKSFKLHFLRMAETKLLGCLFYVAAINFVRNLVCEDTLYLTDDLIVQVDNG